MSRRRVMAAVVMCWLAGSSVAWAQGSITGVVRDASGGVLPGVTVEARSPVLIEQVRTAVRDGVGRYRVIDLDPGAYEVTFRLPGFATLVRSGVSIEGALAATVDAELQVGALEESVTVTTASSIVDVQNARRQQVLDDDILKAIPTIRGYVGLLRLVPSLKLGPNNLNVPTTPGGVHIFSGHGGRGAGDGVMQLDGLSVGVAFNGGGVSGYVLDLGNAEEVSFTTSGGLGEVEIGGPTFNVVPQTGGNVFRGSFFASGAGAWSQGDNVDATLQAQGVTDAGLVNAWDMNGAVGGPILRDRLWFHVNVRSFGQMSDLPGQFGNLHAGDPTSWIYEADPSVQHRQARSQRTTALRLTAQLSPRNKIGAFYDYQQLCDGSARIPQADWCRSAGSGWVATSTLGGAGNSPEWTGSSDNHFRVAQASWTSPLTDRLLLEAGYSSYFSRWGWMEPPGAITDLEPVFTLRPNPIGHRAQALRASNWQDTSLWRASASYVTGSHNVKVGYQGAYLRSETTQFANTGLWYIFFTPGQPIVINQAYSAWNMRDRTSTAALYAQDQWTRDRLTLQGALRYDRAWSHAPAGQGWNGTDRFRPEPIAFSRTDGVRGFHDITPRLGVAYDVFGTGKTSAKVNLGRYLEAASNDVLGAGRTIVYGATNPARSFVWATPRNWFDANGNYVPDCDLLNPSAQNRIGSGGDLCGPWNNQRFGADGGALAVNPDVLGGWGIRPDDWQLGVSIQHEILPRTSIEVGYHRRWFGNEFVTDNRAAGPADYDPFTVMAPLDDRLPGGGGYPITEYDIRPDLFGQVDNYFTFASDFGQQTLYWHGVDIDVNTRLLNGLTFQGGTSTGRGVRDVCDTRPKIDSPSTRGCRVVEPWKTTFKGLVSYVVPRADVLLSATVQLQPWLGGSDRASSGSSLQALYNFPNAEVQTSLGRPLAGNAGQTPAIDLLLPGEVYGDAVRQVDLRVGKILRFGGMRWQVALDVYNLFNANPTLLFNEEYGNGSAWLDARQVLLARFMRWNLTVDW